MPEHDNDNDKLEGFFRKAAGKPEISFDENDWKKLEARLDARATQLSVVKKTRNKIAGLVILAVLLMSSLYWLKRANEKSPEVSKVNNAGAVLNDIDEVSDAGSLSSKPGSTSDENNDDGIPKKIIPESNEVAPAEVPEGISQEKSIQQPLPGSEILTTEFFHQKDYKGEQPLIGEGTNEKQEFQTQNSTVEKIGIDQLEKDKIFKELIEISPAIADKIKQKADVELPGAEEEDRGKADAIVREEQRSDQKKHLAPQRLSLLLSLAPDFSSTSLNEYTTPGEAFGVMIHYHVRNVWSISAGVVKNTKKYTGDGEDYKPPKGYWKYYTNGITPYSIEGACNILEIPVMLQYTVAEVGRSKFMVGAGASSYIMLKETYLYNFEQPNPGAKTGWNSKHSSRFLFNMVNFTIGFEHQILPGFMIGIEPYLKIPIEEIGWSNLKLFSTGASITLRYSILKKEYSSMPTRSRGPD